MMLVQEHAIGTVPLIAAAHQNAGYGLGLLVDLALNVINVGQLGKICPGVRELAVVKLAVVQQDSSDGVVISGPLRLSPLSQAVSPANKMRPTTHTIRVFKLIPSLAM